MNTHVVRITTSNKEKGYLPCWPQYGERGVSGVGPKSSDDFPMVVEEMERGSGRVLTILVALTRGGEQDRAGLHPGGEE